MGWSRNRPQRLDRSTGRSKPRHSERSEQPLSGLKVEKEEFLTSFGTAALGGVPLFCQKL